jgi:hypothetical protein
LAGGVHSAAFGDVVGLALALTCEHEQAVVVLRREVGDLGGAGEGRLR